MKKIISILCILIGVGIISVPFISNRLVKQSVNKSIVVLEEISIEEIDENQTREVEFDYSSVRDVSLSRVITNTNEIDYKSIVGYLEIDDLNVYLPILKGVNDGNLLKGATTMQEGQEMGKGNYSLAGHYINDKKTLFGPLLDIEVGILVKITNKRVIYEYKIYDTVLVPETAMYMLDDERADERGRPIISLMTCYYTSKNGQRYFALGELVDAYPYDSDTIEVE